MKIHIVKLYFGSPYEPDEFQIGAFSTFELAEQARIETLKDIENILAADQEPNSHLDMIKSMLDDYANVTMYELDLDQVNRIETIYTPI
jgi:hypothetical protein